MVKVSIDKTKCVGCGACVAVCPECFVLKDGKASIKKSAVKEVTCEKDAADGCPVGAIKVE